MNNILVWTINQTVWSALPEGNATIIIYANDTLGHTSSEAIIIIKNIPSRGNGSDSFMIWFLIALIGGISIGISIIVVITRTHFKKEIV